MGASHEKAAGHTARGSLGGAVLSAAACIDGKMPCGLVRTCQKRFAISGQRRLASLQEGLSRSGPFRAWLTRTRNRFPQQKVFQDHLPFAGSEWSTTNTACYFGSDFLWPRLSFDDLVKRVAAWAAEKRSCIGTRHSDAAATDRANSNRSWPRMTVR
jgi:hypothetical protein